MLTQDTSKDVRYKDLFQKYSANTDGKEKIAAFLQGLAPANSPRVLLDLGAGDGRLASQLTRAFDSVIAVERNDAFASMLSNIPGVQPVKSSVEDFTPAEPFDVGLFCYSLSGVSSARQQDCLNRLLTWRKPGGRLLFVTYEDGCEWDCYADTVYSELGIPRSGGLARHSQELNRNGFSVSTIGRLETSIWGSCSKSLFDNLAFFFEKKVQDDYAKQERFMQALSSLERQSSKGVFMGVTEVIVEISPK
jgi:SAM-dependent methyltransferase